MLRKFLHQKPRNQLTAQRFMLLQIENKSHEMQPSKNRSPKWAGDGKEGINKLFFNIKKKNAFLIALINFLVASLLWHFAIASIKAR